MIGLPVHPACRVRVAPRRAIKLPTMLIPEAAICRANSLPIPDEAPVTSAHGPNLSLSSAALISLLRSACLGLVVT